MTKELISSGNGLLAQNTTITTNAAESPFADAENQRSTSTNENSAVQKTSTPEDKQTSFIDENETRHPSTNQDAALKASSNEMPQQSSTNQDAALKSSTNHDVALKLSDNEVGADTFTSDVRSSKQWNHQIRDQKFRELIKDERPLISEATKEDPAARRSNARRKSPIPVVLTNRAKKPVAAAAKKKKQPKELSGIKKAIVSELKKTAEQLVYGNAAAAYPYYNNMQRYG